MKIKSFLIGFIVISLLVTFVFFAQNTTTEIKDSKEIKDNKEIKVSQKRQVVSIDELIMQPNLFKGVIEISGTVQKSTTPESFFILGCDDACIMIPVEYNKQLPKPDMKITAIGELSKTKEGKYFFKATDIKNEK